MSHARYTLGIDIGGTKTAAAVVSESGEVIGFTETATPAAAGPTAVIDTAVSVARQAIVAAPARPDACGIGTAGTVDRLGVVTRATKALPGWQGVNLTERFTRALHLPVAVRNDVHATALGEVRHGAAAGAGLAVVIAIGTGIGGAIIHDGTVISGASGSAGSIGHVTVTWPTAQRCACGGWNHLEAYACGPAIEARYALATGTATRLPDISNRARAGEAAAREVIDVAARLLGQALVQVVTVIDPDMIVLTGGVAALADLIGDPIRTIITGQALPGPNRAQLHFSTLGVRAAILGAASAVRAEHPTAHRQEGR